MKQFVESLLYEFFAIIPPILFIHVQFQSPNPPARGCGTRERRKAKFGSRPNYSLSLCHSSPLHGFEQAYRGGQVNAGEQTVSSHGF